MILKDGWDSNKISSTAIYGPSSKEVFTSWCWISLRPASWQARTTHTGKRFRFLSCFKMLQASFTDTHLNLIINVPWEHFTLKLMARVSLQSSQWDRVRPTVWECSRSHWAPDLENHWEVQWCHFLFGDDGKRPWLRIPNDPLSIPIPSSNIQYHHIVRTCSRQQLEFI